MKFKVTRTKEGYLMEGKIKPVTSQSKVYHYIQTRSAWIFKKYDEVIITIEGVKDESNNH